MIVEQKTWKDFGLNFYGKISIRCTDPTRSNSGNMFAGLVANTLNNGDVVDESSVEAILPQTKQLFARLGMMERSSGDIFRKFITTGTNNSMVVGYESQIVEFIVANPDKRKLIQEPGLRSVSRADGLEFAPDRQPQRPGDRLIEAMHGRGDSATGLERARFPLRPGGDPTPTRRPCNSIASPRRSRS